MRRECGVLFEAAHEAGPAGKGEQFGGEELGPIVFAEAETVEVVEHGVGGGEGEVLLTLELFVEPGEVAGEDAARAGEERAHAEVEAEIAMRHGPIGHALVEEDGAEADQPGVDDVVDGAGLGGLFLVGDSAGEAGIEEGTAGGVAKVAGEVALFGAPEDGGGVELADPGGEHGATKRAAGEAREDDGIWLAFEDGVEIGDLDAAALELFAIGGFGHVGLGAEEVSGFDDGLFEGQVLERVQGVVVDEDSDRALHGQQVGCVVQRVPETFEARVTVVFRAHSATAVDESYRNTTDR